MSELFKLKNGTVLLSTEAPGGIYNSAQLKKIADLCSKELAIVKATEDQRLALFVKESEVDQVVMQLRTMGLGFRHYQDNLHQPVSCLGELCEEHEQPAMATAMDLTKEIANIQLDAPLKIGINGCARCCTPCHTLDIAIVGDTTGYRISLGGKSSQIPEVASFFAEAVPPAELPKKIRSVIEAFKVQAEPGETLHDVIERCGVAEFVKVLAPYSQDAAPRTDPFASETSDGELNLDHLKTADHLADDLDSLGSIAEPEADLLDESDLSLSEDLELANLNDDLNTLDNDSFDELDEIPIQQDAAHALQSDLGVNEIDDEFDASEEDLTELETVKAEPEVLEIEMDESAPVNEDLLDTGLAAEEMVLLDEGLETDLEADICLENFEFLAEIPEDDLDLGDDELGSELDLSPNKNLLPDDIAELVKDDDELELNVSLPDDAAATEEMTELDEPVDLAPEDLDDLDTEEISLTEEGSPMELDFSKEEDIELSGTEIVEVSGEDELEESLELTDNLDFDLDEADLRSPDADVLEDLDDLPQLDDVLNLKKLPTVATRSEAKAADPSSDDFGEELPSDMASLSDENESAFEQKLHESIEEESRLMATAVEDANRGDRQAALTLMESPQDEEFDESEDLSMKPISVSTREFNEPNAQEVAQLNSHQVGHKLKTKRSREFCFSTVTFCEDQLQVGFESGAYLEIDLRVLILGERRNFRLGELNLSVTHGSEGYVLEADGVRLFHPKVSLSAAS